MIKSMCDAFPGRRIAYYYFDFQDVEKQRAESFIRSILRQLVADEPSMPHSISTMYKEYKDRGLSPSLDKLSSALAGLLRNSTEETYILVDALDEVSDSNIRNEVINRLTNWYSQNSTHTHILVTSRDVLNIREAIKDIEIPHHSIRLAETVVRADINDYIQSRLEGSDFKRCGPALKEKIRDTIKSKSDGM